MKISLRERVAPALALGLAAAFAPLLIELAFGHTKVNVTADVHFYAVGMTALVAAVASVALTVMGARLSDTRTVLIGTAFAVMAALLALHGIGTPGVIFPTSGYGVVMLTGGATLPAGAAILALSALELPKLLRGVKPLLVLQVVLLAAVLGMGITALFYPELLPEVPAANSPLADGVLITGLILFALLAWRALRTFMLTRRAGDLLVAVGIVWLATALLAALTMTWSDLGW
jgi:hypothetical protein